MDLNGPTKGEVMIMKKLDFIADILSFWVRSHAPGGWDVGWITKRQRELETETNAQLYKGEYE